MPSSIPGSSRWRSAPATREAPDGYVPKLFGHGRLAFTVDQGQHTQRYQGVVPLEGADPGRLRPHLFPPVRAAADRHQDRGPAHVVGRHARHWRAAALMVQQMPEFDAGRIDVDREQREDDWRKAVILMASATEAEMLDPGLPARRCSTACSTRAAAPVRAAAFRRALPLQPRAHRPRAALDQARGARRPARHDRRVAVKCEFCSTEYTYDDSDLDRIYASAA